MRAAMLPLMARMYTVGVGMLRVPDTRDEGGPEGDDLIVQPNNIGCDIGNRNVMLYYRQWDELFGWMTIASGITMHAFPYSGCDETAWMIPIVNLWIHDVNMMLASSCGE